MRVRGVGGWGEGAGAGGVCDGGGGWGAGGRGGGAVLGHVLRDSVWFISRRQAPPPVLQDIIHVTW